MRLVVLFLSLFVILNSCKDYKNSEEQVAYLLNKNSEKLPKIQDSITIDNLWHKMVFEKGGCLGGQQYFNESNSFIEGDLVFKNKYWEKLKNFDKTQFSNFLFLKLADTTKTKIHTCPFFTATNGEMAVYALQKIHRINWYDFSVFKEFKDKEYESATEQPQIWLQKILTNETSKNKLKKLFENKLDD